MYMLVFRWLEPSAARADSAQRIIAEMLKIEGKPNFTSRAYHQMRDDYGAKYPFRSTTISVSAEVGPVTIFNAPYLPAGTIAPLATTLPR